MAKKLFSIFTLVLMVLLLVSACGNSDDNDSAGGNGNDNQASEQKNSDNNGEAATVDVYASNFKFDKDEYHVPAGKPVTFVLHDKEGQHGFQIEGQDVNITKDGGKATVTLKPGTYNAHCSIFCGSGHNEMKTKIVAE